MDKQIMIDGVDVSGCDFLAKEDDYCSYSGETRAYKGQCGCSDEEMCKDHPNCFYKKALKQLKRKERECERLENENKRLVGELANNVFDSFDELDQLKASLDEKNDLLQKLGISATGEFKRIKYYIDKLKAENEKLKEFQKLLEEQMEFNKSELEWSLSSEIKRSEILLKAFKKADKQKDNWREKAEKLLKTLAEIKGLSQSITDEFEDMDTEQQLCYCQQISTQILQKIRDLEV